MRSIVDDQVDTVVADPRSAAMLAVADRALTYLVKAGQFLDVDLDEIAGMVTLISLERRLGFRTWAIVANRAPSIRPMCFR